MNDTSSCASGAALLQRLVMLEKRARASEDRRELTFVMVNETNALAPYRQAALWARDMDVPGEGASSGKVRGKVVALSGMATPAADSAFNVWLGDLLTRHCCGENAAEPCTLSVPPDSDDWRMWQEYLPERALWMPLPLGRGGRARDGDAQSPERNASLQAGLVLWRDEEWTRQEISALGLLCDAYAHAWWALGGGTRSWFAQGGWKNAMARLRTKRWRLAVLAILAAVLLFPLRQSVLAPAEVVPHDPFSVRAPLHGVVDRITVLPNGEVREGDLLVRIDAREIEGKLEAARQALAVSDAELRQGQQQALFDERSKAALGVLRSRRDQAAGDVEYLESMLARTEIRAERSGVAVFDDPQEWSGRPVAPGERIMVIADPLDVELEAHIPLADAIELSPGSEVRLFMNAEPASPVQATLDMVGYRAAAMADGTSAYRAWAAFDARPDGSGPPLRVGLKGTAKLYGKRTFLAVYLLRKPLTMVRLWLGI